MTEEERIKIIRDLTAQGMSCAKIAPYAECSSGQVNRIQRAVGIKRMVAKDGSPPPREELLACAGMTSGEMCKKYRRSFVTIQKWLVDAGIRRVPCGPRAGALIDLHQMRALVADGFCGKDIAAKMGFTPSGILYIARREGIELPKGDPQAHSRERPSRAEFAKAYAKYKAADLAGLYGVREGTISKWALHYGLRKEAPPRPNRRILSPRAATRPIAGSCTPRAIRRALAKVGAR